MNESERLYDQAADILHACTHEPKVTYWKYQQTCLAGCWECGQRINPIMKAARKAFLAADRAARPVCARCGQKPSTWAWGGYDLCGRCLKLSRGEHVGAANHAGVFAMLAAGAMVDDRTWARPRARKEA